MGETHDFSIYGIGAGGTGLQTISATGDVYNLNDLADFPGTYTGLRFGLTLIKGRVRAKLKNDQGVVLYLTGKATGLASSTGADKFIVTMSDAEAPYGPERVDGGERSPLLETNPPMAGGLADPTR